MGTKLPSLAELPRRNISQLKTNWSEIVLLVREPGGAVIVDGECVEMVLMDVSKYLEITRVNEVRISLNKNMLEDLYNRFEKQISELPKPDAMLILKKLIEEKGRSSSN